MKDTRSWLLASLIVLLFVPCSSMAQFFHSSDKLSATVTGRGSDKPLRGAVVVVVWKLAKGMLHGNDYQVLHKVETVTDEHGAFHIEPWGPKYVGLFWNMGGSSPYAYILKSGYKIGYVSNYSNAFGGFRCPNSKFAEVSRGIPTHTDSTIVASWNGCKITLMQSTQSPDKDAMWLSSTRMNLCSEGHAIQCSQPLRRYFDEERRRLLELGAKNYYLQW